MLTMVAGKRKPQKKVVVKKVVPVKRTKAKQPESNSLKKKITRLYKKRYNLFL